MSPIVTLLFGPSGHGKSLLLRVDESVYRYVVYLVTANKESTPCHRCSPSYVRSFDLAVSPNNSIQRMEHPYAHTPP
ncbi:hypothetical protein BDR04DRAFT_234652 [Suillus decipiens]|nr:hypothetical protein BDR04DRAFT_234652 [Suillus decipiens]